MSVKKVIVQATAGAAAAAMFFTQPVMASGVDSVTQPLANLKTLVISIIGAVGVIILAKMSWNLHRHTSSRTVLQ